MRKELLVLGLVKELRTVTEVRFDPYSPPYLVEDLKDLTAPELGRRAEVARLALALMAVMACDKDFRVQLFKGDRALKTVRRARRRAAAHTSLRRTRAGS